MDVKDRVRRYIVESLLMSDDAGDAIADDASLIERNVLDSTGVLELAAFLEETFQIHIAEGDLVPENLDTVAGIAAFVERKRPRAAVG